MSSDKMKFEGMERRRFIRLEDASVAYSISKEASPGGVLFAKNVSPGGIRISTSEKLSLNTPLILRIVLPNSKKPILVKGKVAWCSESPCNNSSTGEHYELGIEFTELTMEDQLLMKSHLANTKKLKDQGVL